MLSSIKASVRHSVHHRSINSYKSETTGDDEELTGSDAGPSRTSLSLYKDIRGPVLRPRSIDQGVEGRQDGLIEAS